MEFIILIKGLFTDEHYENQILLRLYNYKRSN